MNFIDEVIKDFSPDVKIFRYLDPSLYVQLSAYSNFNWTEYYRYNFNKIKIRELFQSILFGNVNVVKEKIFNDKMNYLLTKYRKIEQKYEYFSYVDKKIITKNVVFNLATFLLETYDEWDDMSSTYKYKVMLIPYC